MIKCRMREIAVSAKLSTPSVPPAKSTILHMLSFENFKAPMEGVKCDY